MAVKSGSTQGRTTGIVATALVHLSILGIALAEWAPPVSNSAADALSVFDVAPELSPELAPDKAETPIRPQQETRAKLPVSSAPPTPRMAPAIALPTPSPRPALQVAPPPPVQLPPVQPPAPSAPPPSPSPPPPRPASAPDVNWESRLLAHIDRHKLYPKMVGSRRPRGTAIILFRMNRQGAVLWTRIERSSGSELLDRAAIDTVRLAAPLPAIPADRAMELQMSVPVEFYNR